MQLSMTEEKPIQQKSQPKARIQKLKTTVQNYKPGVCIERAMIWTAYFKKRGNRKKPRVIQMAEALKDVLLKKSIHIYPDELINFFPDLLPISLTCRFNDCRHEMSSKGCAFYGGRIDPQKADIIESRLTSYKRIMEEISF